jgi:hypothetical protein
MNLGEESKDFLPHGRDEASTHNRLCNMAALDEANPTLTSTMRLVFQILKLRPNDDCENRLNADQGR